MENFSAQDVLTAQPVWNHEKPKAFVSIGSTSNQQKLKESLSQSLHLVNSSLNTDCRQCDLFIINEKVFQDNQQTLKELKRDSSPVFLPIILITGDRGIVRDNSAMLKMADDVIYSPVTASVVESRMNQLLRHRRNSVELERKNRELERLKNKLEDEKERFRLITENATDMIARLDPNGNYRYVSQACGDILGYGPKELEGQNAFDSIHPHDLERFEEAEKKIIRKQTVTIRLRRQQKNGEYIWVETTIKPIANEETGAITELQESTRSISRQKKYEKKLKSEKEFIDMAVRSLPEIFYMIDEDHNFVKWNNIERDLGYTDEEVAGMHPLDFYREEDQKEVIGKIDEAFRTGSAEAELEMVSKSGELVPYYITARKFNREDGNYLVGTCVNLSSMREIERKLRESRQRWIKLVKNDPNLIQILSSDGTIEFINNAGARILGYDDPDQLIDENYLSLVDIKGEDHNVFKRQMQKVLDGNEVDSHIFEVEDKGGDNRYLESQAVPISLQNNEPGFQQVAKDVTERVRYERRLEESLKEKKVLLSEIHHRVKNNMAVVSGLLTLQRFESNDGEVHSTLLDCERRIKSMALIHEKLYQTESFSNLNFENYVKDLIKTIRKTMDIQENISFRYDCDPVQLNVNQAVPCGLIISELVSNALEHAFEGREEGKILFKLGTKNNNVHIVVEDDGVGLPNISSEKDSMGFTIVDTLINQLDATLDIKRDNGTRFKLSFEKQEIKGSSSSLLDD